MEVADSLWLPLKGKAEREKNKEASHSRSCFAFAHLLRRIVFISINKSSLK